MLPSKEKKWYALYTKSRTEKKVYQLLTEKGIDTYLPLIKTLKQWSDRKKWVEEPLFRSYIFIKITEKERLNAIRTDGVVRMITFQGKPVSIPNKQIEAVRAYINEGEDRIEKEAKAAWEEAQRATKKAAKAAAKVEDAVRSAEKLEVKTKKNKEG